MNKEYIIKTIRDEKAYISERYGVMEIGLFGSYAKSEQSSESDIDIIVELKAPKYEWLAGLQVFLEKRFNRKVDLIRKSARVNQRILKKIIEDVIYV